MKYNIFRIYTKDLGLNIVSIVGYIASISLLYIRQYLLSKDPSHKMVQREDHADPGDIFILIYNMSEHYLNLTVKQIFY
ncbi:hypothetical protein NQ317_007593 [Molorchus minor]|uniref:Uncharacterized protein n=1 Tax=Molorchus minor TaxID=1323400 RepID=A0ABQ9IWJ4_9CUCU|nr:hypothetical protein NQ317_007593 [Molorchus minor]